MTYLIAKLLRRDPRMVERKKTGKAKARKGVSCSFLLKTAILIPFSVHLGQAIMITFCLYPRSDLAFRLHIQSILDNNRAMICTTIQIEFSLENNEDNYKNKTITKSYVSETKFLRTMIAKRREDRNEESDYTHYWKYKV